MTKFGFIGVGNIGGALAREFRDLDFEARVANSRGPASLKEFADEIGAIASTVEEVILNSDIIVISLPQSAISSLPKHLFANLPAEVVVIDVGSYFSMRDGSIKDIDDGMVHSVWVAAQLGRPVLKAFNNVGAATLHTKKAPVGHADRVALPVFGDSAEQKKILLDLIERMGFDGVDGGPLSESWRLQPGAAAFCTDYDRVTVTRALDNAIKSEGRVRLAVLSSRFGEMYAVQDKIAWFRELWEEPYESVLAQYEALGK